MADRPTDEERLATLHARLGLEESHRLEPSTFIEALTHKSWGNEHRTNAHNERLEFLGDAVVDLAVSHRLMERFPKASEGELSKLRALLVSEDALARVGQAMGLGDLLLLGRGEELSGGRAKASVLADAVEAVLGAVYLTLGLDVALRVVDTRFADLIAEIENGRGAEDPKSRLQEWAQLRKQGTPRYRVVNEEGPGHEKRFEVEVAIGETTFARGIGRSKKEAEQAAAQKTLALVLPVEQKGNSTEET